MCTCPLQTPYPFPPLVAYIFKKTSPPHTFINILSSHLLCMHISSA